MDTVVWCTGYDYAFPFLEGSGLLTPPVSARVHPLYEQLFHVQHPSLSFIGLQQRWACVMRFLRLPRDTGQPYKSVPMSPLFMIRNIFRPIFILP